MSEQRKARITEWDEGNGQLDPYGTLLYAQVEGEDGRKIPYTTPKKEELYSERELCSMARWVAQHVRAMVAPRIGEGEPALPPALPVTSGMDLRRLSFKGNILHPLRIVERYELYVASDGRWRLYENRTYSTATAVL